MSPERSGRLAYWHAGGAIETHAGSISPQRAAALCRWHVQEALCAVQNTDIALGIFCAGVSLEIVRAIVACDAWRRARAD